MLGRLLHVFTNGIPDGSAQEGSNCKNNVLVTRGKIGNQHSENGKQYGPDDSPLGALAGWYVCYFLMRMARAFPTLWHIEFFFKR